MSQELLSAIISAAITVIGAISIYVVNYLKTKSLKQRLQTLEEFIASDETEYYIECPNCKQKIILNKVKILANK